MRTSKKNQVNCRTMNATTDQIDAATEAYQRKREPHGDAQNHREALGAALRTVGPFRIMELRAAEDAYAQHRHPARWDGKPWGECGTRNHRAGIRAALNSLAGGRRVKTGAAEGKRYHETVEAALADGWDRAWYGDLRQDGTRRVYGSVRPYHQRVCRCFFRTMNAKGQPHLPTQTDD
jgi:hypothetical protein